MSGRGATAKELLGLVQELGREAGTVQRWRARQGDGPRTSSQRVAMNHSPYRSDQQRCDNPTVICGTNHLVAVLAQAVQAAHDKHVIHRDLKPANVLLAEDGS